MRPTNHMGLGMRPTNHMGLRMRPTNHMGLGMRPTNCMGTFLASFSGTCLFTWERKNKDAWMEGLGMRPTNHWSVCAQHRACNRRDL